MANDRRVMWRTLDVAVGDAHECNAVEIDVYHGKGGTNFFTGEYMQAGFWLSVHPVKVEDRSVSMILGNSIGRRFHLASVPRFNAKKLEQLAAAIKPATADIVAALLRGDYAAIKADIEARINTSVAA